MRSGAGFSALSPAPHPPPYDAWRSPVPYLFGGLATMLGLIAFALLILACSYWRLSGYLDGADADSGRRPGDGKQGSAWPKPTPCFGEGFVVIMAGDDKPTYLATPISSKPPPFADSGQDKAPAAEVTGTEVREG